MATPEALWRLMEQLKNMEHALTEILMESLLKIASVTSTTVFLLVEESVGGVRRIAASPRFADAFKNGVLVPTGEEVEISLVQDGGSVSVVHNPFVVEPESSLVANPALSRRRGQKRIFDVLGGESSGRSKHFKRTAKPSSAPTTSSSSLDVVVLKSEVEDIVESESSRDVLSVQPVDTNSLTKPEVDDDSPVYLPTSIPAIPLFASDVDGFVPERSNPDRNGFPDAWHPPELSAKTTPELYGFDVEKYLLENEKYRTVANIKDIAIMEKSHTYNKLLTSFLYDISKMVVLHSPFRENKNKQNAEYFNKVFEIVWEHFPYLNELNEMRLKFNGKSPRYFVRHTMQAYCIVLMSKCVAQTKDMG